ncbi:hypothetical protein HPB50_023160 [Hyalomma asiaticum]|uniref:Uncharacterized protein n=1 Tax=Hyalomma asiaticum TaxID=266040 RepID=A0ACB7TPW4_HYAAI|nr:hypothetical protein HPB50_023160 [Hyalomma asiaticum]
MPSTLAVHPGGAVCSTGEAEEDESVSWTLSREVRAVARAVAVWRSNDQSQLSIRNMLPVKSFLVVFTLVILGTGCSATARRRRNKDVSEACVNEGVRVSECRASFITELEMMHSANQNNQHTNCTLYSKLECCMVTEYGALGCGDKEAINKAISFAIRDHQSYENCPKGLCDPASVNGSFKIMRDMDENLHGRDAVSGLVNSPKRKVKRDVHAAMEAQAHEGGIKANKSYLEEHLKAPKHKGKKKGHKKGHKGKKGKRPKLTADDLPKTAVSSAHKSYGSLEAVTGKVHNDETSSALPAVVSVAGHDKENISSGMNALERKSSTDMPKNIEAKNDSLVASAPPTLPAAVAPVNSTATNASSLGNVSVAGGVGGHDALANVKVPISIEIVKNISLSDIGKTPKKTHRRRRHHKNKSSKGALISETTKAMPEVSTTHSSEATSDQSLVSNVGGKRSFVHSEGVPADGHQPTVAVSESALGASEAPSRSRAKLEMKGGITADTSSIASVNKSSADHFNHSNRAGASGEEPKIDAGKQGSSGEIMADKSAVSSTTVGNQTKDKLLNEKKQKDEASAHTGLEGKKAEIVNKEHGNETAQVDLNKTAVAASDGLKQDVKNTGKFDDAEKHTTKLAQEGNLDKDIATFAPLSEQFDDAQKRTTKLTQEANLDKDIATFAPLSEISGESGNLLRIPDGSKANPSNNSELADTKLVGNAGSGSGSAKSSTNSSGKSFAPDTAHQNTSSTEKEKNASATEKFVAEKDKPKSSKLSDVPEISLAVHRLEKKHDISSGASSLAHESIGDRARKMSNQTKVHDKSESEGHPGTANASAAHNETVHNHTMEEELPTSARRHVDNQTGALSEAAVNLKDPKQVFGSGPLIEVKGNKGGSVEKQMVHAYETGESVENIRGKNSLIDDLVEQYGSGSSEYDFKYGRDSKRRRRQRFRDDDDAPKVRRKQWDGDEPFEVDTTRDPFQEYPNVKDGDPRTGGLYAGNRGRRHPADEENVRIARHKKVHRRKPENDYNYESMVRWKLLEELDSILDPKNSPDVETVNRPPKPEFRHEKDDDMDQWKRRLEALKVQVQAQSGERIVGRVDDSFRDAEAMRDGEMYYRKYRRQGPLAYGQGYEGVERPIVKDPLIHQAKKRFWIERQESDASKYVHNTERPGAADIQLRPLPEAPGRELPPAMETAERRPLSDSIGVLREAAPYAEGHRLISRESRIASGLGARRLSNRRIARARRLRGSRGSRKLHKNLKDTEGLKILRNDDLQAEDDEDDDDEGDDDDEDDDDDDEKEAGSVKKSTLPAISPKGQVGRVDAAERPLMSFGERVHTMEPTKTTPKREVKPAGNLVGSAESPDCVPDTLRAHTDYCRGIYTKHQLSIEEARKTASKKTMACYKLESIKGCLSAGSYFSKCVGSNNNEFQELQGSVMSQMRDLRCGSTMVSGSTMLLLLVLSLNYLLRAGN